MHTTDRSTTTLGAEVNDLTRMSHRHDPHTSADAAEAATDSGKIARLQGAIIAMLRYGPGTPSEVLDRYQQIRDRIGWLPPVDLYDVRRRMTELHHDLGRIEPIIVGTRKGGKPQYATRDGQRVMRLVEAVAA